MPTYDYECKKCGHNFEAFQNMSDEPLSVCEKCGGELRRLIGAGMGIIFKGSGFYVTDNRPSSPKGAEKSKTSEKTSEGNGNNGSDGSAASNGTKKETSSQSSKESATAKKD